MDASTSYSSSSRSTKNTASSSGTATTRSHYSAISQYGSIRPTPLGPISDAVEVGNVQRSVAARNKSHPNTLSSQQSARSHGERIKDSFSSLFSSRFYFTNFSPRSLRRSYVYRRFPCNKQIWLVYAMFLLQGLAEFSALLFLFFGLDAYKVLNPPETVAAYLAARCLVFLGNPVMGFIADSCLGRYRTMRISLYVCLLGAVILAVCFTTNELDPWLKHDEVDHYGRLDFSQQEQWPKGAVAVIAVGYTVMLIGVTGVQVNLIPFGVDQLVEASSGELSSYFHWYFWWLTAGYLVSATTVPYIYQNYSLAVFFLLLAVCFTAEIVILIVYRDEFVLQPLIGNQLKLMYQVVKSCIRAKKPVFRSAFDIGRPPPSRIDRTMDINGGKFTVEQVEDVKTVLRILVILLSFLGYFAVSSQLLTSYILEGTRTTVPHATYKDCTQHLLSSTHYFDNFSRSIECRMWTVPPSSWMALVTFVPILILILLVDRLLYVSCRPKMLKRIATGNIFLFISILVAIAVEYVRIHKLGKHIELDESSTIIINAIPFHTESAATFHIASPLDIMFIAPQYFLFAFAEVFASITAVEFIYAQSPGAMKGLLLGMLFLTTGMAMGFSALIIYLQKYAHRFHFLSYFGNSKSYVKDILECAAQPHETEKCWDGPLFSYIILAVTVVLSGIVFMIAAVKYTFRRRDIEPFDPRV